MCGLFISVSIIFAAVSAGAWVFCRSHNDNELSSSLHLCSTIIVFVLALVLLITHLQNKDKEMVLRGVCFEGLQPSSVVYEFEGNDTIISAYEYYNSKTNGPVKVKREKK